MFPKLPNGISLYTRYKYSDPEFNKHYEGTKFYVFLNDDLMCGGDNCQLGLNKHSKPFDPKETYWGGGFYFYDESTYHKNFAEHKTKLAFIEIPNDANVFICNSNYLFGNNIYDHFRADKINITKIMDFNDVDDDFWINTIPQNSYALKYVKEQTEELCILAVQQYSHVFKRDPESCATFDDWGITLEYVNQQYKTYEICVLAVQKYGYALQYVPEQLRTEEICNLAVQNTWLALQYVPEHLQTKEICKLAVQENGCALEFVKEQTEELCKLAVQGTSYAIRYVKEQTEELCKLASQNYDQNYNDDYDDDDIPELV